MQEHQHWTARRSRRRLNGYWEIVNLHHDTVAVVYGGEDDAELLASAPQHYAAAHELYACTKRLIAILGQFDERLVQSERDALNRAREVASRICVSNQTHHG